MKRLECLGEITAPSGIVLIVDAGLLNLWSHDRPPLVPPGVLPPAIEAAANSAVDLSIVGRDAVLAGRAFGRQTWSPTHICDIPREGIEEVRGLFALAIGKQRLDARLEVLPKRVSHRVRVDITLLNAPGGIVQFHGVWATAIAKIPSDRPLKLFGERMPENSEFFDRWRSVRLEVAPEGKVAFSARIGDVMVDRARLMFVDVDSLHAWEHENSLDGKADFVFWGVDASKAARRAKAPQLGDGNFGWKNLPVREAADLGLAVEADRTKSGLRFATDFRPHSHHHFVMEQIRTTTTESATLEVGGARLCAFATSWGDGCFPVFLDLDLDGRLVNIRVELSGDHV